MAEQNAATASVGQAPMINQLAIIRIAIGLAQGLFFWFLFEAEETKSWPWSDHRLFATLLLLDAFIPPILLSGLGAKPIATFVWAIVAAGAIYGLASYDIWRQAAGADAVISGPIIVFLALGLFVAHHLVMAALEERRIVARYPTYFDTAWKHAVQLALSFTFVGAFWLVLSVGSALFSLINLDFLDKLTEKAWFSIPATTVVFAAAVHLTDVQQRLINGIRGVALLLLSWLSPVMGLLAIAFLCALVFTGLEPLWATRSATFILLTAAAALVALINATYQDGEDSDQVHPVLRVVVRATAIALVPLVAIAAYATWLRVEQYGFTPERVFAIACVAVAGWYALGYALSALWPEKWMQPVGTINVLGAAISLSTFLLLFSPLADPAKISVADQMRRLESGTVSPDAFDFTFLRFEGERWGNEALQKLRDAGGAVGAKAEAALKMKNRWDVEPVEELPPSTPQPSKEDAVAALGKAIVVYPTGRVLPDSFLKQDWPSATTVTNCVPDTCDAFFADVDGDSQEEVLIHNRGVITAYKSYGGTWEAFGTYDTGTCANVVEDMRAGKFKAVPSSVLDLEVGDDRLHLVQPCQG